MTYLRAKWIVLPVFVVICACPSATSGSDKKRSHKGGNEGRVNPISLTAADGTGLQLVDLRAEAVIEGPLAFTQLHLSFLNDEDRVREGRFEITLPEGAAISRFAMKIKGMWQEAEVVERQRARQSYESYLHQRLDPALLEKKAGNQFRARVFPIGANETKELVVSWSEELTQPYRLLVQGLPRVENFYARIRSATLDGKSRTWKERYREELVEKHQYVPTKDFVVKNVHLSHNLPFGLRGGDLAVMQLPMQVKNGKAPMGDLTILFDTSASAAIGFNQKVNELKKLVGALVKKNGDFSLQVFCYDQDFIQVFNGKASKLRQPHMRRVKSRLALGASDLVRALHRIGKGRVPHRILIVGDGMLTAGKTDTGAVSSAVNMLRKKGTQRIDVITPGAVKDGNMLSTLVTGGKQTGVILGADSPHAVARTLLLDTLDDVTVGVSNAEWVWPEVLKGVQDGDTRLVFAKLSPQSPLRVQIGGELQHEIVIPTQKVSLPLLERAAANAQIQLMTHQVAGIEDEMERSELHEAVVGLSKKYRVLSDFTAMLVLETSSAYSRFGIERDALSSILIVDENGIGLESREDITSVGWKDRFVQNQNGELQSGRRQRGSEGRAGQSRSNGTTGDGAEAVEAIEVVNEMIEEEKNREMAINSGIVAPLQPAVSNIPFGSDSALERSPENALGVLMGKQVGDELGNGVVSTAEREQTSGESFPGLVEADLDVGAGLPGLETDDLDKVAAQNTFHAKQLRPRRTHAPSIRTGAAMVRGSLGRNVIKRYVKLHHNEVKFCYEKALLGNHLISGRLNVHFVISSRGSVLSAVARPDSIADEGLQQCVINTVKKWTFPQPPDGGVITVVWPYVFHPGKGVTQRERRQLVRQERRTQRRIAQQREALQREARERATRIEKQISPMFRSEEQEERRHRRPPEIQPEDPWSGRFRFVMNMVKANELDEAFVQATAWRQEEPGDVLAVLALGEVFEAQDQIRQAARAYGSVIDLFPSRAEMRRLAGQRLERLGRNGLLLAMDTYRKAVEERPDHPSSHRLYAFALLQAGMHKAAFDALTDGMNQKYPRGRYRGVEEILQQDAGIVAQVWLHHSPSERSTIQKRLKKYEIEMSSGPSARFILYWESDSNDVDLHVYDGYGDVANYDQTELESGGELVADVQNGYGPEGFIINERPKGFPYAFQARYFDQGPMGYGLGALQIIECDGNGNVAFQSNSFVMMNERSYVGLGNYEQPLLPDNRSPVASL